MGVLYSLFPLNDESRNKLATAYGIVDAGWPVGHNPRLAELLKTLDSLAGCRVVLDPSPVPGHAWGVTVEQATHPEDGPWTMLRTLHYHESEPLEIYFEKGWPELIGEIVSVLAVRCGTFCIVPDTGDKPLIVPPGASPKQLLEEWDHMNATADDEPEIDS